MSQCALASDHAGFVLKQFLFRSLPDFFLDFGCHSASIRCDYSDYTIKVARLIASKKVRGAVLICFSGNGMSMAMNRFSFIRSAVVWTSGLARLATEHNNANVICIPSSQVLNEDVVGIIEAWRTSVFLQGRHQVRLDKITSDL